MTLEKLDVAINDLMEKFCLGETNEAENQFLRNITEDLVELLAPYGNSGQIKKLLDERR